MKKISGFIILVCSYFFGQAQTGSFSSSSETPAVPVLKLSGGSGSTPNSGGAIEFSGGATYLHPMGRIYTSNQYSSGVGNSKGKLILSSYFNAYKDELTLWNGNVGINVGNPAYPLDVNGIGQFTGNTKIGQGPTGFYADGSNHAVRAYAINTAGGFFIQDANGVNTYLYVQQTGNRDGVNNGNVGIGTTAPGAKLSFGLNVGKAAIHFYDAPPGNRFGIGLQNAEMQMFVSNGSHFSWNSGGDLQPSDSNELMRLSTSGNLGLKGKVVISSSDSAAPKLDIDPKNNYETSSFVRLIGATVQPAFYNLTIRKVDSKLYPGNHPTFDYNFDHYQYSGINNTQLSLKSTGTVEIGGGLTIKDNVGALIGGSINPGIDGLVTNGGNKFLINAGTIVRVDAPLLQARKIKVTITTSDWADYVFASGYHLTPLTSVEKFIDKYKHLPDVPSAQQLEKNGLDIGAGQAVLMKKIEELTLYVIQQDKVNMQQQKLINDQQEILDTLKKEMHNRGNQSIK